MPSDRKKILFVHYNPNSSGSFVDKIVTQFHFFSEKYDIEFMLPEDGEFTEIIDSFAVPCHRRAMHENEGILAYAKNLISFAVFLKLRKIDFIYFLDFVWWKPAEILAASLLDVPMLTFTGFYKTKESLAGFLSKMDLIVVNSHKTAEMYLANGYEERVRVIHNFIDPEKYRSASSIRESISSSDTFLIGYVGVLHSIKGIEYLIDAMPEILARCPNAKLLIVGNEKEKGVRSELEQRVANLSLESKIEFAGRREDIPALMKSFDVLVVPSIDEPFGYINIEAGAAGTAVVATAVGGIPEIVLDRETGLLVPPKDAHAIAQAVLRLQEDKQLRLKLGEAAAKRVSEHFSPAVILAKWEDVFLEMERIS